MRSILVGYDDTEPAQRALRRALEYASAFGASLVVVSVAPLLVGAGRGLGAVDPVSDTAEHERQLEVARAVVDAAGVTADYVTSTGDPVDSLLAWAEERGADLLVVGTREPSLLARLFGQSVSAGVARRARCDVLIVHG